ncbi:MAG: hypothetical protein EA412_14045 [Chitinophagaceae bacterium]|nr:MAG: hypothetical protein EA412_14045 [Chitinophagaceae bacterium]
MFRIFFILFVSILFFSACKKETIEREVKEDLVIEGNIPPPSGSIPAIKIENYINRVYIDMLGITPSEQQMESHKIFLAENEYSKTARETVINEVLSNPLFYRRYHERNSFNMLEGIDSATIAENILIFGFVYQNAIDNGEILEAQFIQLEIDRMQKLLDAREDFAQGEINVNNYYRRLINNFFYDEINMGSENFAIATFENFFLRLPTSSELNRSVEMIDGSPEQLFQVSGSGKGDFMNIVTQSQEFHSGLVSRIYNFLLIRNPTAVEINTNATILEQDRNIKDLFVTILISEEYASF